MRNSAGGFTALPFGSFPASGNLVLVPRAQEESEAYTFALSTGFQITRRLSASVSYLHTLRLSNLPLHDYNQNTYTLSLGYRF